MGLTIAFWCLLGLLFVYILPSYSIYLFIALLLAWAGLWIYVFRKKAQKLWFFLSFIILVVVVWGLLNLSFVQNLLISKVTSTLSKELQTKVSVKKIDIRFFDRLILNGLMVEDKKKDTLLYAGEARVNITDWFFFKDKIVLKNVGLDDAYINMNRSDSVWNYQFIIDYFSGPSKTNTKKKKGPDLQVNELHFNNINFNRIDGWIGQNMIASFKKLDLVMDSMNIDKKAIAIKDIYLEKPVFAQADYEGKKPKTTNLTTILGKIPVVSAFKWNNSGWVVSLGKLQIFEGTFRNDKFTNRDVYADRFDGQHILFREINGNFSNVIFLNDTLHGAITLSAKERSGLNINKLQSNLKFTPELMEFNALDLRTDKSKLGDYYSMSYQTFNKDMSSFLHNVTLEANFKESTLSSDDLAIFAPNLSSMKRAFHLEGRAKGTIDNFSAKAMKIRTGSTYLDGDLSMRGLPDINTTFIDLKSNIFQTNYTELSSIVPSLKKVTKPSLAKLGNIQYIGNYTGFITDFVAYGNIHTNLGNLQADLNMKLPQNAQPVYSGTISTQGFQLGQFIGDNNFGNVVLNGTIKGSGFTLNKLNAVFKGNINQLYYGGYTYRNATVDGTLKNKIFDGHLSIDDPNIKIKRLDGQFSFANKEMAFNADAELEHLDFKSLGISKDKMTLSGIFNLNFTGNNIDNFLGTARVYNATLQHEDSRLSFDSLTLKSFIQDSIKNLELETNELYAKLNGKFNVQQLPDAFTIFLSRYYPTYIKAPNKQVTEQDFAFEVKTRNVDEYIKLFDKRLSGFNNSEINGSIKLSSNELTINAKVPEFSYDGKVFTGISLAGTGTRDTLYTDITAADIKVSDSMHFPDTRIKLTAHNDVSLIKLNTSANKTLNAAELNASIQSFDDGVRIHFFPSEFVLNDKKWELEKDGELTLRKNYPIGANEIKFVSGDQEIVISSEMEEETSNVNLVARLKSVVLEDILPFFVTKPDFKGTLTGTATVRDPFGNPFIRFEGVTDSLVMDGSYMGKVDLAGTVDTKTGMVTFKTGTDGDEYAFDADGFYNYKDSTGNRMNINFLGERIRLEALQPYLSTVFSKLDGVAKGNLTIKDNGKDKSILGEVTIDTGSVTVAYTQCRYLLSNETISFGENSIDLGMLRLKDTLGNLGTVSGRMEHNFFRNFYFRNMRFETSKLLLLNTTKKDNIQFYGNVIGSALMTMNGPTSDLRMNIDGQPSSVDSSHIYLPTGAEAREGTKIDYIEFIQFGSKMDNATSNTQASNILVNLNITANPACKVDVILDEETGDIIKAQGNGKLSISVGTTEPLSIRGRYELTRGEYTFNFQTFLKRPFTLNQGSITWNGDPYLATIQIDAEYLAKNVDISTLTPTSTGVRSKADIIVLAHLTGNLKKPEIDFEFKFDAGSEASRDFFAVKKLEDYKNDQNNMFKQVASLLLLNSFISEEQAFLSGQNTFNIAAGTVGGIMSSWLTNIFNKELERATNGVISTYIDINPTVDLQSRANQLQANVRAGLKIFLSSRVNLLVAGNYDYNNPYVQLDRKGLFTPDISIEWLLNKDGSLRVVGFNRTSVDFTSSQRNRSGVQLAYRKEFDNIADIFKSRKKIQQKESIKYRVVSADSTKTPGVPQ